MMSLKKYNIVPETYLISFALIVEETLCIILNLHVCSYVWEAKNKVGCQKLLKKNP